MSFAAASQINQVLEEMRSAHQTFNLPIYAALRKIKAANKPNKRTATKRLARRAAPRTRAIRDMRESSTVLSWLLTAGYVSQAVVTSPAVDTSNG
jgi:hypothetical protein